MQRMVAVQEDSKKSEQPGLVKDVSAHGRGDENSLSLKSFPTQPFYGAMIRPCQYWPQWFGKLPCLQDPCMEAEVGEAALPSCASVWAELSVHCQDGKDVALSSANGG